MKAGKLAPEKLQALVLGRFAHRRADVLVPARLGEDCAVIDFGAEVCVLSTDPITGAASGAGRLAVHISCNDVAANGGTPIGVQVVLLLPESTAEVDIARIMDDVETGCCELGIEVLGGHTEIISHVSIPVIVTTAIGRAPKSAYVTSGGARPGDAVIVTKALGLEGSAILANDWARLIEEKAGAGVKPVEATTESQLHLAIESARTFAAELSAVRDGITAAAYGVSAMHDITEGGLYGGLYEMGKASGVGFCIDAAQIPIRPATKLICATLGIDPLGLISSGSMLITAPDGPGLIRHLQNVGVSATIIGIAVAEAGNILKQPDGTQQEMPLLAEDELWRFLAAT